MNKVFDKILSQEISPFGNRYLVSPRTVSDFFTEGIYKLKIPDYQRPYSWTEKNIKDLFEDVLKLTINEESSWFLGPIFTVRNLSDDKYSELLDGQQRITTIQIILREATLLVLKWHDIDLSNHQDLKRKLKKIVELCNRCLVKINGIINEPVFETEPDMNIHFKDYIVDFQDIDSLEDLEFQREQFKEKTLLAKKEGSVTADTILSAIQVISKLFNREFFGHNNPIENVSNFCDFIECLCTRCWIIEIPLQTHEDSIQIFESLNNRGKSLTLVDKLRFKSIVNSSSGNIHFIRLKWKQIYSGINFLIDQNYVKSEDDFYKVFFNSIKGSNITKEEEFLNLFVDTYLLNDETINLFLSETLTIIDFYKIINSSLNIDNEFVNSFDKKTQIKVKSLLQVFKSCLNISDNSRLLLFAVIRKHDNFIENRFPIMQSFWNIIREVLYVEVYKNKKSNEVRTLYMEKLTGVKNSSFMVDLKSLHFNNSILGLLKTNNSAEAKFLLSVYAYLFDLESLCSHSPSQYEYFQLDHLFPVKWTNNWRNNHYTKDEIISFLKELKETKKIELSNINWDSIIIDIEGLDSFELDNNKPKSIDESIIQFIGNKWILHSGTNITTSNKKFEFKKSEYSSQNWIKIPSNTNNLGINSYDCFTAREIILRSVQLVNSIISRINNSWDYV